MALCRSAEERLGNAPSGNAPERETARDASRRSGDSRSRRLNRTNGLSDIEGKAATVAASECGQRTSFNTAHPRRKELPSRRNF